jgi:hypothetical protein
VYHRRFRVAETDASPASASSGDVPARVRFDSVRPPEDRREEARRDPFRRDEDPPAADWRDDV